MDYIHCDKKYINFGYHVTVNIADSPCNVIKNKQSHLKQCELKRHDQLTYTHFEIAIWW